MNFQRRDLEENGFEGFIDISHLKENGCGDIPKDMGVYVVIRESLDDVCFLKEFSFINLNVDNTRIKHIVII